MTELTGLYYQPSSKDPTAQKSPIQVDDIVEFRFQDLMETMFANSNFGKLIAKHSLERCFFHMKRAHDFQPEHGWHNFILYVIYFIKDGELFKEYQEDEPPTDATNNYNTWDIDQRFLLYISKKQSFYSHGHSQKVMLDLSDLIAPNNVNVVDNA